jgi:phosphatidylglycerophosphate synthase
MPPTHLPAFVRQCKTPVESRGGLDAGQPQRAALPKSAMTEREMNLDDQDKPQQVEGCILGDCEVRLWSLTSHERLRRQLRGAGVTRIVDRDEAARAKGSVLFVRADHLYDARTIQDLVKAKQTLLEIRPPRSRPIAVGAHVRGADTGAVVARLEGADGTGILRGIEVRTPDDLSSSYVEKLLKSEPPAVLPIREEQRPVLERHLFDGAYKGVTDLVTKWVWPRPARSAARLCARFGVRPNVVTLVSLVLVVLAAWLFTLGHFELGLLAAWLMTFLDTVDGKLARVTVDSTKIGHLLDHGLDVIHPPFWYFAWGYGLLVAIPTVDTRRLSFALGSIVVGYVAGRLFEAVFDFWLGRFSLFCWRPVDSYFRLIMARRNPNLLILTGGVLLGRPDRALLAVAAWTVACSIFLGVRLGMAIYSRVTEGRLRPWLADMRGADGELSWAARPFARQAIVRYPVG